MLGRDLSSAYTVLGSESTRQQLVSLQPKIFFSFQSVCPKSWMSSWSSDKYLGSMQLLASRMGKTRTDIGTAEIFSLDDMELCSAMVNGRPDAQYLSISISKDDLSIIHSSSSYFIYIHIYNSYKYNVPSYMLLFDRGYCFSNHIDEYAMIITTLSVHPYPFILHTVMYGIFCHSNNNYYHFSFIFYFSIILTYQSIIIIMIM